jgi:hypothetical protein
MGIQKTFNNFQNLGYSVSYFKVTNVSHDTLNDCTNYQYLVYTSHADKLAGCSPVAVMVGNSKMIGEHNPMRIENISQDGMDERKAVYEKILSGSTYGTSRYRGIEYDLSDGVEI